jgi:putative transposase
VVLRAATISRSTFYHRRSHVALEHAGKGGRPVPGCCVLWDGSLVSDEQVKEWISELVEGDGRAYGYLKLTKALRREYGLLINKKKVYRLCKEMWLLMPQRKLKRHHPKRLARNREINTPNQLWEIDIKYGYVWAERRFFFVMSILDVYDRSVVYSHIGLTATAQEAAIALGHALWSRQLIGSETMPVIRSDNGPQFVSEAFEAACNGYGIEHERIPCRTPNKNAHIESFHRILQEECLAGQEFGSFGEAYAEVARFLEFYNKVRLHSSIGYRPPQEFYEATQSKGAITQLVRV